MPDTSNVPVKSEKTAMEPAGKTASWHPFEALHQEIDRLFADFGHGFPSLGFGRSRFETKPFWSAGWPLSPAVDVVDKGTSYQITAELPGLDEKNVEVTVADNLLTIKGEKKEESEDRKKGYYRSERSFGAFQRCFELPDSVDQSRIEANFQKGVLTIALHKTEDVQARARKISITSK